MRENEKREYCHIEEATLIWHYSNGFSKEKGDIRWAITDLYRTASGDYFLYVSGGPGSNYAVKENIASVWGDEFYYTSGEAIIPMSLEDVIGLGEENLPDILLRKVLKDIQQQAKHQNEGIPKMLEDSIENLHMREKEAKRRIAIAKANQESQARQMKYYEQFVEL